MYVTQKVYSHSLIHMQLRLSNLSANCLLVKAWGLPPLGATVDGEVEKPVGRNWPPPLVIRHQLFYWIARVVARWRRPKADRLIATRLNGYTSWRLWFWYTIECMKARLGRVKSGVDKEIYLLHWQCVFGVRYWALNDESFEWRIQSIWNNLQPGSSDRNTRIA